jgi:hypothetical protein
MEQKLHTHQFETDKYSRHYNYVEGEKVWIKNITRNKLQPRWIGPLRIKHLTKYNTVLLEDEQGNALRRQVSMDRIRPWNPITVVSGDRIGGDMLTDEGLNAMDGPGVLMIGGGKWEIHAERNNDHQSEYRINEGGISSTNQTMGSHMKTTANQLEPRQIPESVELANQREVPQCIVEPLAVDCQV